MSWFPDEVQRLVALEQCLSSSWAHLHAHRRSLGYCHVTVDALTAAAVAELGELVALAEQDADLDVLVLVLAGDDGPVGWGDVLTRLARARPISVAAIRGHVGGAGRELALACDLRIGTRADPGFELDELVADERFEEEVEEIAWRLAGS